MTGHNYGSTLVAMNLGTGLLGVVGLFLIGFSIPIRDFSLGSTLILAPLP